MTRASETILEIEDLHVSFTDADGLVEVVRGSSLSVGEGEVVGLVGESGCGKSVTALACLGLTPSNTVVAGSIKVCGRQVIGARESGLRNLRGGVAAMIFQNPMAAMNPFLTIGRQMMDTVRCHLDLSRQAARGAALEALESVRLADPGPTLDKYPHQLSGGQLQRVMVAMALACRPRLLIADEPTTALDVTVQAQVLELVRELADRRGLSILFITHDLGVVATICDRLAVMYAGQVVERGSVGEVFAAPRHPYTAGLLATVPRLGRSGDSLAAIPGTVPDLRRPPPGCAFAPRCGAVDSMCVEEMPSAVAAGGHLVRCHRPLAPGGGS